MFIIENHHYSVNVGTGMGVDMAVAPDMLKLKAVGDIEGVEIYRFKRYCQSFINKQSETDRKKK